MKNDDEVTIIGTKTIGTIIATRKKDYGGYDKYDSGCDEYKVCCIDHSGYHTDWYTEDELKMRAK